MNDSPLKKDIIDDPSRWRLVMRYAPTELAVLAYAPLIPGQMLVRRFRLTPSTENPLAPLEDAVFGNPLLLEAEFRKVDISIAGIPAMAVPAGCSDDQVRELLAYAMGGDRHSSDELLRAATGDSSAEIAALLPHRLTAFLRRSFLNPSLHPHIAPLVRYFMALSTRGNTRKIYLNFRDEEGIDIVATDRSRLLSANSFEPRTAADAAYYTIATRASLAANTAGQTHEATLMTSGDSPLKEEAIAQLRESGAEVMPVIFPGSMLHAGREATELPFDLVALALNS